MQPKPTTRRAFMGQCATCALALPAAKLLGGCAVDVLSSAFTLDLTGFPNLDIVDQTVFVDVGLRQPLAITRTGTGDADFIVLGSECNHLNCGVERVGEGYTCPCHGSKFASDGALLEGPASAGLSQYTFTLDGDLMTIHPR